MPFNFRNLDDETRRLMAEEIERAFPVNDDNLYFSTRFNDQGHERWPQLLLEAAKSHDDGWLAKQLEAEGLFKGSEGSATPSGGRVIKDVPYTAAETLAEGQFNRYYMIAISRRAIAADSDQVVVYRAKGCSRYGWFHRGL